MTTRLGRFLPILGWLPEYGRQDLRGDLAAGVTVAVMLIPQGMGYAMLAGLPPIVGLYASLLPPVAYALFGTSRPLAVGPVAMDSLLVAVAVGAVAESGTADYLAAAVTLAAMVGAIQLAFGVLGFGFVVTLLSRPVISGFTSAAALIIGFSQLTHLLGVEVPRTHQIHRVLSAALDQIGSWHWLTLGLGVGSVALLVALKRFAPKIPRAMVAVVISVLSVWTLGLADAGVSIVGAVPAGLPGFSLPRIDLQLMQALWPSAATIALVAFIEAVSVGKTFARRDGHELQPGQELVALGAANLAGSLVGGYPVTGGFSRTAVAAQAGARSPLAGVFAASIVALTLLVLTPAFYFMPKAVLAAIIMAAVFGLFDGREPIRLWRVKRNDAWMLLFTFVMTLAAGIQVGILAGVALSLGVLIAGTTTPHVAVLGRVPGSESYLNVDRHPHVETFPGVLILRMDAQFYFGNAAFLRKTLAKLEADRDEPLRAVVLDASGINQIDSSGEEVLCELDDAYHRRGVRLILSRVKGPVRDVMQRSGFMDRLSSQHRVFLRTHEAVRSALGEVLEHCEHRVRSDDPREAADQVGCGTIDLDESA